MFWNPLWTWTWNLNLSLRLLLAGMTKVTNPFLLPATLFWFIFFSGWLSPCQVQRRRALGVRDVPVVGIHVPDCKADGGYHPVQCDVLSGYCWCVDEYGYEVKGSRIKGRPSCGKGIQVTYKIAVIDIVIAFEDQSCSFENTNFWCFTLRFVMELIIACTS